ncbi:MAG: LamG domain-containing protein [Calditrichaeota bacterium]|nr:MAG: LamG domain-containing protein [Calditrichota bacterium]
MLIHKADGTVDDYEISIVDSITFIDSTSSIFDDLIVYYPFKGNANDVSGNGNHGTPLGNATTTSVLTLNNNNSDRLKVPYNVINGLNDFTISAKLRIDILHGSSPGIGGPCNTLIGSYVGNLFPSNALNITYNTNFQKWRIEIYPPGNPGSEHWFDTNTLIEDGNWHHFAFTREGAVVKLFIDGTQIGNGVSYKNSTLLSDSLGCVIGQEQDSLDGSYDPNQSWAGQMDNIRIYGRALNSQEINLLFNIDGN